MAEYIDREKLIEEVCRLSTHYLNEWDTLGVLAAIDRIPAADVQPVVRAHWIDEGPHIRCSNCDFTCDDEFYLGAKISCPNCGADMREVDDGT